MTAHRNLRHEAWQHAGCPADDYISWLADQWSDYDRLHGITANDRALSLVTYHQHQEAFTAWLLAGCPGPQEVSA